MLPVESWELVYGDGSRFTSQDGPWTEAPAQDVQVLIMYHAAPYKTLTYGVDEYLLPGETSVKFGAWMTDEDFEALIREVVGPWPRPTP